MALSDLVLAREVLVLVLHCRRHDLGQRELDVLLVLVFVGDENQFLQEFESVLALVDRRVLDADLQESLALIQLVDVRFRLGGGLADLHQVLQNLVDLCHYLPILLIELKELDEQLQLVLVNVDDLHFVSDNVLGLFLAVFLHLVLDELFLYLPGYLKELVHVEENRLDYGHGCRVDVHVFATLTFPFGLLRGRRDIPVQLRLDLLVVLVGFLEGLQPVGHNSVDLQVELLVREGLEELD